MNTMKDKTLLWKTGNLTKKALKPGEFDIASDAKSEVVVGSAGRGDEGVRLTSADDTVDMKMTVTVPKTETADFHHTRGQDRHGPPGRRYTLTVKNRDGRAAATKLYTLTLPVTVAAS